MPTKKRKTTKRKSSKQVAAQKKFKTKMAKAKKMYNAKGNKKSWKTTVKAAFK